MKKKTYLLFIMALLQTGLVCNYQLVCAEPLPTEPNNIIDKQFPEQPYKPIIDHNKAVDSNQSAIPKDTDSNRLSIDKLRAEIYKAGLECFRREMDNYKWVIEFSLYTLGIVVAIFGILVTLIGYMFVQKSKKSADKSQKERSLNEIITEASTAYSNKEYKTAAENYRQIHDKYGLRSRQLFNMLGSSLLNWAGTIGEKDKQNELAKEAIEKYLKAEALTKGIAAYNIACCYAILDDKDECEKWLNTAKEKRRLPSWERASGDRDLKKYAVRKWFRLIWGFE